MSANGSLPNRRFRPGIIDLASWNPVPAGGTFDHGVPFARTEENSLELLKNRLLREVLGNLQTPEFLAPIRRAANEAASLSWMEPFPLLVFPELLAEKVIEATRQATRQQRIRARSARIMEALA